MFVSLSGIYLGVSALMSRRNPHGSFICFGPTGKSGWGKHCPPLPSGVGLHSGPWSQIQALSCSSGAHRHSDPIQYFFFLVLSLSALFFTSSLALSILAPLVPNSSVENLRLPAPVTDEAVQEETSRLPGLLSMTRHFSPPCFSEKSFSPFPLLPFLPPPSKPALQMLMLQRVLIGILLSPPTPQQTQQVPRWNQSISFPYASNHPPATTSD